MNDENCFQKISFKEVSFEDRSLKELEEHIEHQHDKRRAETSSYSQDSFRKDQLAEKRAKTNSFSTHSLQKRILSLQMCLQIFLFWSLQLAGAALYLTNCSFRISLPTESLQPEELAAAYTKKSFAQQSHHQEKASSRMSFQQESMQQDELQLAYLHQLDPDNSLSFPQYGSISYSYQLQADSFDRISFELRASICAALLQTIRIRNRQPQSFQLSDQKSLQLPEVQLRSLIQGGAFIALQKRASSPTFAMFSFHLDSFDLAQLELSTQCLAQNSKQDSLERHSFETELVQNILVNNLFPQISFNESFANNIFQKISFSISFDNNLFQNNK